MNDPHLRDLVVQGAWFLTDDRISLKTELQSHRGANFDFCDPVPLDSNSDSCRAIIVT